MQAFETIYFYMDPVAIWAFRLVANPYLGFVMGLVWLCLLTTVIGELSMAGIYFLNKRHFAKIHDEMVRNHNLSIKALVLAKDKQSYKACNTMANEYFGQSFFSGIALFASSLWPAFLVLGWLDYRFSGVDFSVPWLGAVGPAFFFVPAYIVIRILFNLAKPWIPVFKTIKRKIKENESGEELLAYKDMFGSREEKAEADRPA